MKAKNLVIALLLSSMLIPFSYQANSQVVISLLFGKKLNTDNVKFGLDGGVNFSNIGNLDASESHTGFNLGLYFDILLKEQSNWYLHTGLILKSPMGADGLAVYSLNDPDLDAAYSDGVVDRQLKYINLPLLARYKFKGHLFIEAGPMLGVLVKATDVFYASVNEDKDHSYENKVTDQYNLFDAGIQAGIGTQLMKGNGMDIGFRAYYGLTDILKDNPGDPQRNTSYYIYASIPIGAGEKAKAKQEAREQKKLEKQGGKEK